MTRRDLVAALAALILAGCGSVAEPARPPPPARVRLFELVNPGASAAPTTSGTASATFATYNLHWLRNPVGVRADLARLDFVTAWAFQEVRSADDLPVRLAELLPAGKWYVAWLPLNRLRELNSDDVEGQAIASRYPIRSAEAWPLTPPGDDRRRKRRAALAAALDVGGTEVLLVNTDHEPAILSLKRGNIRQARKLATHLANRGGGDRPAIVAGDFNTAGSIPRLVSARRDRAELCRVMSVHGFEGAVAPGRATFRAGPYAAALDHVFVRGLTQSACGVDDRAVGSDHRPVWCRVVVPMRVTADPSSLRTASPDGP